MVRKVGKDIWTSLGGRPEGNETEEETLLREIKEENVGTDFNQSPIFIELIIQ